MDEKQLSECDVIYFYRIFVQLFSTEYLCFDVFWQVHNSVLASQQEDP